MVCPEIVDGSKEGNLKVEEEINLPTTVEGAKSTEQREDERNEKRGFWSWFWF